MPEPAEDQIDKQIPISQAEEEGLHRAEWFKRIGSAYALEHATRPSTIGFALGSNPISLLAWYVEGDELPLRSP
jgi:microsomal epoxide hydrolase